MLTKLIFAALLAITTAIPIDLITHPILPPIPRSIDESHQILTRRGDELTSSAPGVYICTLPGWRGNCYWEDAAPGYCHRYNLGTTSSFGPDHGLLCEIFTGGNCDGDGVLVQFPGFATGFPERVLSWMCKDV
jgi:hypothetical protein